MGGEASEVFTWIFLSDDWDLFASNLYLESAMQALKEVSDMLLPLNYGSKWKVRLLCIPDTSEA